MQSKRGELVPIGNAISSLDDGPVQALREASPPAQQHFTLADQVDQLVGASEADADLGFMARMMALCSLPRTNPGNQKEFKRVNGPFTLYMQSGPGNKLPYGNFPRLILAWVCTEAVQTQSRVIVLGRSLSKFMRALGVYSTGGGNVHTKLRNQMKRLFDCTVKLTYKDANVERFVHSPIAESGEYWWNPQRPDQPSLWDSKIELSEKFFQEIIHHPVPFDMNTLTALKRCSLGLDLYLWLAYRTFTPSRSATAHLASVVPSIRPESKQRGHSQCRPKLPPPHPTRVEEDQAGLAGPELLDGSGRPDPAPFDADDRAAQSRPARELISPFPWRASRSRACSGGSRPL